MGMFNIFGNLFRKDQTQDNSYLSLVICPDRVLAAIWAFEGDQVKNLGFGRKELTSSDILLHQAAIAIDSAGRQAKVNISKTVFGISHFYLEDGSPSPQTAKILKNLCQELELEPQAFIPIPTALNHFLKIEQSITPQAVLVAIFSDFCEVHLLSGNQVVKTQTAKGAINIEKIQNLIQSLKEENQQLPSRIIVCGLDQVSPLAAKIAKVAWPAIFVHEPKVDFLDEKDLAQAVSVAQAADILGYDPQITQGVSREPEKQPQPKHLPNELGFIEDEDILKTAASPETDEEDNQPAPVFQDQPPLAVDHQDSALREDQMLSASTQQEPNVSQTDDSLPFFSKVLAFLPKSPPGKKLAIILGLVLILGIVGIYVLGQTITSAEVVIKVNPRTQEHEFTAASSQISGRTLTGRAQGSQKAVATGSKKIGESARGEVTVFNWTTAPKSFAEDTGLITQSGIKFTLDGDIQVASRSASTPGQTKAPVTAVDFGPSGNIPQGTDFTFQQFDALSYSAASDNSFTGGAERQSTVVTAQDLERLEKSLLETVSIKAKDDLKNQAAGAMIFDEATLIKILKKQFDKKLDEEAALINLDLEIEADSVVFAEDDLRKFLAADFQDEIPQNLQVRPEDIQIVQTQVSRNKDILEISGKFKANLIPKFDEDNVKGQVAGKSLKETRGIILALGEVSDVSVNFKPKIPFLNSLPRNKDKIQFKITN